MNDNPLVSVIIPNYNHARYLDQRLQTVLNQTYQNFEVIILDDCSTDNSLEVIAKYKDNQHISQIVVNEQNSGSTFKQWDKGIHLAKGELIWIAESDDYCELNLLEELVGAMMKRKNVVVAYTSLVIVDENGKENGRCKIRRTQYYDGKKFVIRYMSLANQIYNASGVLFNRQIALKVSSEYTTFIGAGDYLFWTQIVEQGVVARVVKNLNFYRICSAAVTSRNFRNGNAAKEDKKVFDYIDKHYHLSKFRKNLSRINHFNMFKDIDFFSEKDKTNVLSIWNVENIRMLKLLSKYCTLQPKFMNHFHVLI